MHIMQRSNIQDEIHDITNLAANRTLMANTN